ncbi:MAG: hypothetical protein ACK5TA_00095, partial [bacterium]
MKPNSIASIPMTLTCLTISLSPVAVLAAEEPLITKPDGKAAEQVEEDIAFFEKKYQRKITGVKPKSEYDDPDQF